MFQYALNNYIANLVVFINFNFKQNGSTPLMYASASGKADIADLLLKNGAKSEVQNKVSHLTVDLQYVQAIIYYH